MLMGPGAPFELTRESVRGVEMTVFARRAPHVPALLAGANERHPDRPYLVFPHVELTYAEVAARVVQAAQVLRDSYGIRKGDRVGIVGANSVEYAVTLWAAVSLGAIGVGLNGWWTGPELVYGIQLTAPKVVFGDERRLARLEGLPELAGDDMPPIQLFDVLFNALPEPLAGEEAQRLGATIPTLCPDLHEDDPLSILFTSGTTGRPKGAVITHRGMVNFGPDAALRGAAQMILDQMAAAAEGGGGGGAQAAGAGGQGGQQAAPPHPVSFQVGPFFHISGIGPLLGHAPYNGMTMVFPPPGKWDPGMQLELTQKYRVTSWAAVPTQLLRLVEHPDLAKYDLSSVTNMGCGGAVLSPEIIRLIDELLPGRSIGSGFGMSETTGIGATTGGRRLRENPTSLGVASPTVDLKIVGPDGDELPDGEIGEICIRCPSNFLGYWDNEEATAKVLDSDGWYRTGDYGHVKDGLIYMESRLRDMIIRGGENIYPIEIENRLLEHPAVADVGVIGVPHRELGQEVMAVILLQPGAEATAEEMKAWAGKTLARFKVPAHIRFVTEMPYSATGKLLKRELEERFAKEPVATQ